MKITHITLTGPVTDYWTYQDNVLPKYHKKMGLDVSMITSKYIYNSEGKVVIDKRNIYENENGIKTIRLKIKNRANINSKFKKYENLYRTIEIENPDIIFVHGCQFWDIRLIAKYAKLHREVKLFVDNHADFLNSGSNWISRNILHKIIWKHCAQLIEPLCEKFYGVLPARVDFLNEIYEIPKEKIELLVMGADDEKVEEARNINIRNSIRAKFNINENDFLIITGGKIDQNKPQTLLLMEAVKNINLENIKLIVLGSVISQYKEKFETLLCDSVQFIGWVDANEVYKYFNAGELAVFPGLHSVFWEQVVGLGKPCVFKNMDGFTHIDLGGNCKYLFEDSVEEIKKVILEIVNNNDLYEKMKNVAMTKGMDTFSYEKIARKSIEY